MWSQKIGQKLKALFSGRPLKKCRILVIELIIHFTISQFSSFQSKVPQKRALSAIFRANPAALHMTMQFT